MISVAYITEKGIAVPYLTACLQYLESQKHIALLPLRFTRFQTWKSAFNKADIVIYQFLRDIGHATQDKMFLECDKKRILFDSQDGSTGDRYPNLASYKFPRIRNVPHESIIKSQNVVVSTTFPVRRVRRHSPNRTIDLSFRVQLRNDTRKEILKLLERYTRTANKDLYFAKNVKYPDYLTQVLISVNAPGNGEACIRHLLTLQAGACMLAHESINGIRLLPNAILVDGEDYVSFKIDNLYSKLDWLLSRPQEIKRISKNGQMKFQEGYSIEKTANKLLSVFRSM